MELVRKKIQDLLKDVLPIKDETIRQDDCLDEITYADNPLNPELLAYCLDVILGFDVRYRIAEKVNYIIEFDYKGTYAVAKHFKMSYRVYIDRKYREELIGIFQQVKVLLEQLFMMTADESLKRNEFSMKNETPEHFNKLKFFEKRIESLEKRRKIIQEKCRGQYVVKKQEGRYTTYTPKCQPYLRELANEIDYDIESYIDSFYSALDHVMTLLYPFAKSTLFEGSYFKNKIRDTKWAWDKKINDTCGKYIPEQLLSELREIKEIYRNHGTHGGFSREMMAYVLIPQFGRYPIYVGKNYLKGFGEGLTMDVSFELYNRAKRVFNQFWAILDEYYEIPMLFIKSGLPIPACTEPYTEGIGSVEAAKWKIEKMLYDIDNQIDMDW